MTSISWKPVSSLARSPERRRHDEIWELLAGLDAAGVGLSAYQAERLRLAALARLADVLRWARDSDSVRVKAADDATLQQLQHTDDMVVIAVNCNRDELGALLTDTGHVQSGQRLWAAVPDKQRGLSSARRDGPVIELDLPDRDGAPFTVRMFPIDPDPVDELRGKLTLADKFPENAGDNLAARSKWFRDRSGD